MVANWGREATVVAAGVEATGIETATGGVEDGRNPFAFTQEACGAGEA
jgi:hypothetical protein